MGEKCSKEKTRKILRLTLATDFFLNLWNFWQKFVVKLFIFCGKWDSLSSHRKSYIFLKEKHQFDLIISKINNHSIILKLEGTSLIFIFWIIPVGICKDSHKSLLRSNFMGKIRRVTKGGRFRLPFFRKKFLDCGDLWVNFII